MYTKTNRGMIRAVVWKDNVSFFLILSIILKGEMPQIIRMVSNFSVIIFKVIPSKLLSNIFESQIAYNEESMALGYVVLNSC